VVTDAQLASLSPRRRQCLRLLNDGLRAKEISQRLQIEEMTVRDHLKAARAALGISDSLTVARLLVDYERRHPQNVGITPQPVVSAEEGDATGAGPTASPRSGQDSSGDQPTPAPAPSPMGGAAAAQPLRFLLFPPLDRPPNDLSAREKIRVIGLEMLIVVAGAAGIVGLLILVNWYLAALKIHGG
jgi:DNA-binding CsgD family transcriptional regulator